jgi:glycosyltransferase involved in cell wall biosynthesis
MSSDYSDVSVIIPARNEAASIADVVAAVRKHVPGCELIVVNDASTDATEHIARDTGAHVVNHPYRKGNGASIKTGARSATRPLLVFLDADGQHPASVIPELVVMVRNGFDMVVGARTTRSQAGSGRRVANAFYNALASWMVSHRIQDLTSGFRAVDATRFRRYLYLLPNGFSYPTTITMAFFRSGFSVGYIPIEASRRRGKSHIKLLNDGVKFLLIIFKVGTLYSPLKVFLPVAMLQGLVGVGYYLYTCLEYGRFTNMSALLLSGSLIVFLIGLVSEQITSLVYKSED